MPKSPDPKKILERIIESHLDMIAYYRSTGMAANHFSIQIEALQLGKYIAQYSDHAPNADVLYYAGRLTDVLK